MDLLFITLLLKDLAVFSFNARPAFASFT